MLRKCFVQNCFGFPRFLLHFVRLQGPNFSHPEPFSVIFGLFCHAFASKCDQSRLFNIIKLFGDYPLFLSTYNLIILILPIAFLFAFFDAPTFAMHLTIFCSFYNGIPACVLYRSLSRFWWAKITHLVFETRGLFPARYALSLPGLLFRHRSPARSPGAPSSPSLFRSNIRSLHPLTSRSPNAILLTEGAADRRLAFQV